MRILLTNDDGIYAPGLAAMRNALARLGEVFVVAPATEQSGVGHSITFLTPLMASQVFEGDEPRGWAVEGSPADCVKLGLAKLCVDDAGQPFRPDLVVSGMNYGLNAGINVLYSGTVAAATEAAINKLPAIAVSLEWDDHARFDTAATMATDVIEQMLEQNAWDNHRLYNLNIPTAATVMPSNPEVRITRMGSSRWDAAFEERLDPKGRRYYWTVGTPPTETPGDDTDIVAINDGAITLSPLVIDRTRDDQLAEMATWNLGLAAGASA